MRAPLKTLITFAAGVVLSAGGIYTYLSLRPDPAAERTEVHQSPPSDPGPAAALPEEPVEEPASPEPAPRRQVTADRPFKMTPADKPVTTPEIPTPPSIEHEPANRDVDAILASKDVPPPPEPNRVTIEAGTVINIILDESLSSNENLEGDRFSASVDRDLVIDGFVIAARGAHVEGNVVAADPGGRVKGTATISLVLTRFVSTDGQEVEITTDTFTKEGKKTVTKDAAKVGGAASVGALIGAIAGGGKGAAIGAAVGGAAGTGAVLGTRGAPAELPAETRLPFRINAPITITERL